MVGEEAKYYSLLLSYAHILAPFYNALFGCLTFGKAGSLRDLVAEFVGPKKGSRILDVATGTGKQAYAFAKRGYDVTGIDLSRDMLKIAIAQNKYDIAKFEIADATKLPFKDNMFDVPAFPLLYTI